MSLGKATEEPPLAENVSQFGKLAGRTPFLRGRDVRNGHKKKKTSRVITKGACEPVERDGQPQGGESGES